MGVTIYTSQNYMIAAVVSAVVEGGQIVATKGTSFAFI